MNIQDKVKIQARLLLERIDYGKLSGVDKEIEAARALLDRILAKYGWKEADIRPEASVVFELDYSPAIATYKGGNPTWLSVLIDLTVKHYQCKAVHFQARVGCTVLGADPSLAIAAIDFALERSQRTFSVYNAVLGTSRKKLDYVSYMTGFAFGYDIALAEFMKDKTSESGATDSEGTQAQRLQLVAGDVNPEALTVIHSEKVSEETLDVDILTIVNDILAEVTSRINDMREEGKATQVAEELRIKDPNAYIIGYSDGVKAKKNLLEKGNL